MSARSTPKPRGWRRLERWFVGLGMAVVALVLERVVIRSVRKQGKTVSTPSPTAVTSRGGEVDWD